MDEVSLGVLRIVVALFLFDVLVVLLHLLFACVLGVVKTISVRSFRFVFGFCVSGIVVNTDQEQKL